MCIAFFGYFCLIFAIYGRFWTLNIKSGLIPSLWMQKGQQNHKKWDQKLIWNFGCSTYPKSHPGVKIDPKMAGGGQNWPQCTPCGPTNLFRAKKTNFETARSKPHFFTRNDPEDTLSANVVKSFPKLAKSESGQIVSEKVKLTYFDVYLSHTM